MVNVTETDIFKILCPKCMQPERLNPKDIKSFDGILNPDWVVNLVNVCDSPNTENKKSP
jgi:hypothetical protein